MATSSSQPGFQEFGRFAKPSQSAAAPVAFKDWNPFTPAGPTEEEVKAQAVKQREDGLAQRETAVEAKEQELTKKEAELNTLFGIAQTIASGFESTKKQHWENNLAELIDFGIGLAEKIILEKVKEDPSVLARQIKTALESVKADEVVEVHVSPDELESLQTHTSDAIKALLSNPNLRWVADLKLKIGEIYIDTKDYRLDASVMTVINNIKQDYQEVKQQALPQATEATEKDPQATPPTEPENK